MVAVVADGVSKVANGACEASKIACTAACTTIRLGSRAIMAGFDLASAALQGAEKVTAGVFAVFKKITEIGIEFKFDVNGVFSGKESDKFSFFLQLKLGQFDLPPLKFQFEMGWFTLKNILSRLFNEILKFFIKLVPGLDKLIDVPVVTKFAAEAIAIMVP